MINTIYPLWFVLFCLLAALTVSVALYYKSYFQSDKKFTSLPNLFLFILRFMAYFLISFFLLSPFIRHQFRKTEKPLIILAADNSKSVLMNKDSLYYKDNMQQDIEALVSKLQSKYEVESFTFGEKIKGGLSLDYSDRRTNISAPLEFFYEHSFNKNLAAVVLLSDGNYNTGSAPLYQLRNFYAPFYTIALGDTTVARDLLINKVLHNSIAYLGNLVPLEIGISANKLKDKSTRLSVVHKGKVLHTEVIRITSDYFQHTSALYLDANEKGLQKFSIRLTAVKGEISYINNSKDIFIDVLESRKNVVILAHAPHPDIAAVRRALEKNDNYGTELFIADEIESKAANTLKAIEKADMLILHQLPSDKYPANSVFSQIEKSNIPYLLIIGTQTSFGRLNNQIAGLNIQQARGRFENAQASLNPLFNYFNLPAEAAYFFNAFPPLTVAFGNYQISAEHQLLAYQRIGQLKTELPLIACNHGLNSRSAFIFGEGMWRWAMTEYRLKNTHDFFNELIYKLVQFVSVKEDRRHFRMLDLKTSFYEDESVIFNAELLNMNYEKLKAAEIKLKLISEQKKEFDYVFTEDANSYTVNAGSLPPGKYNFIASTLLNDKMEYLRGEILVKELDLEFLNTTADHHLLHNIAVHNDGALFYPHQLDELAEELLQKDFRQRIYFSFESQDLISLKFLFFIILLLLSAEWFFRKYFGSY